MANNTNSITVVGNLTRDPEMRYTPSGVSTVTLRRRRQPLVAQPADQRVGGAHQLLQRRVLASARRERRGVAQEGHAGRRRPAGSSSAAGRPSRARSARSSRSSPTRSAEPAVRDRRGAPHRAQWPRRRRRRRVGATAATGRRQPRRWPTQLRRLRRGTVLVAQTMRNDNRRARRPRTGARSRRRRRSSPPRTSTGSTTRT